MDYTMHYEGWDIRLHQQSGILTAYCRNLSGEGDAWQSPPCKTAQKLWWVVDRFFLWELELFPTRRCLERDIFRTEFMELAESLEVTP